MLRTDHNKFIYSPQKNNLELNLVFAYSVPVSPKSMVVTFKWDPQDNAAAEKLSLTWSDALGSYFAYAPKADHAGLRNGSSIILPCPGSLEIRILNWPSKTPAPPKSISGLYAGIRTSKTGAAFTELQRIREIGSNA